MPDLSFVAIDFETANSSRDSACQVGYAIVDGGKIRTIGSELCRPLWCDGPDDFDDFNISIHGIEWDDVKDKPTFPDVWKMISQQFGDRPFVAHNAAFDIRVLQYSLDEDDELNFDPIMYTCTLVCSRRILNLPSYGLPYVASELGVKLENHHDAGEDARACAEIAIELCRRVQAKSLNDLLKAAQVRWGEFAYGEVVGSVAKQVRMKLPKPSRDASPDHVLFGKCICLTGTLPGGLLRREAIERIAYFGGIPQNGVNKQTNILVIGELNPQFVVNDENLSAKMLKALALREGGQQIEFISGYDFLSWLE
jgi:DNA polymerase III epsilon subunit-like protein